MQIATRDHIPNLLNDLNLRGFWSEMGIQQGKFSLLGVASHPTKNLTDAQGEPTDRLAFLCSVLRRKRVVESHLSQQCWQYPPTVWEILLFSQEKTLSLTIASPLSGIKSISLKLQPI